LCLTSQKTVHKKKIYYKIFILLISITGACRTHRRSNKKFLLEYLKGRDQLEKLGVSERILLIWILNKQVD
jgi:hypothetical protein